MTLTDCSLHFTLGAGNILQEEMESLAFVGHELAVVVLGFSPAAARSTVFVCWMENERVAFNRAGAVFLNAYCEAHI